MKREFAVLEDSKSFGGGGACFAEDGEGVLRWCDFGSVVLDERVSAVQLVHMVERGDSVCAETALRVLASKCGQQQQQEQQQEQQEQQEQHNSFLDDSLVRRVVAAVGRSDAAASVLQQALRSLAPLPRFAASIHRLALDAANDSRAATRAECLKVLASSSASSDKTAFGDSLRHIENGLIEFASSDSDGRVRASAVEGLCALQQRGASRAALAALWETALRALDDDEWRVREQAVRLLWLLGCRHADEHTPGGGGQGGGSLRDRAFVVMCAAILDPCLKVREVAAALIGSMPCASHQHMMQSLSKKTSQDLAGAPNSSGNVVVVPGNLEAQWGSDSLIDQQSVGAFVHALEEEFAEVRLAALKSMCELSLKYAPFAAEALEHIVDMLHDESSDVRLEAIHSLRRMGAAGGLGTARLRSEHLALLMFLLSEAHTGIRRAVQQLLQEVAHPDTASFRNTVVCLCGNFVRYEEDFDHVLAALAGLGRRHAFMVELLVEQLLGLDLPGFLVQERTIGDRQYVAVLILLLSAGCENPCVMNHVPALSRKHADYLKLKYRHLFFIGGDHDEHSASDSKDVFMIEKDALRALQMLHQGFREDALLLFERHVASSRGSTSFAAVWISVIQAVLAGGRPEELSRLLYQLEFGFLGLPEHFKKRLAELRQSFVSVLPPQDFLADAAQSKPLTGQIMVASTFGVDFLGQLSYPVQMRGMFSWPTSSPTQDFAIFCVFPDRSYQIVELATTFASSADHIEFSASANWKVRNRAWSESCLVHVTLVRRFPAANTTICINIEPKPILSEEAGGILGIATTAIAIRPKIR